MGSSYCAAGGATGSLVGRITVGLAGWLSGCITRGIFSVRDFSYSTLAICFNEGFVGGAD